MSISENVIANNAKCIKVQR